MTDHVVIVGAGIVGVSTGIWLRRFGAEVTIVDRLPPGQGTSYGNGGVLAACAMVPVTSPGLLPKAPKMLMDPEYPLFLKWGYLPKLVPWLLKYLGNANDADTRRIAKGLTPIVGDSVEQHLSLTDGLGARDWVVPSDYTFAYSNRAGFDAESYTWDLRKTAGFEPEVITGGAVHEYEPNLGADIGCLAIMKDHGHVLDPGGYVEALAKDFVALGGKIRQAEIQDVDIANGSVTSVSTSEGAISCDRLVLATGVWSGPLMEKLGIKVPLESERGYHIVFEGAENGPSRPFMIAQGKFVATPMTRGLRCAGVIEFGGLNAPASRKPFEFLRKQVKVAFPKLKATSEEEWMGHRPAPSDSLPLIGEIGATGVYTAFGHHHIGLTGGPKTGRMVAGLITERSPNTDLTPYSPHRFS